MWPPSLYYHSSVFLFHPFCCWSGFDLSISNLKYGLICSPPTTCCQYPVAINGDSLGVLRHLRQIGTLQLLYTFHIYSQTTSTIHIVLSYTHSIRLLSLLLEQNAKMRPVYERCCCCLLTWLEHYANNFVSELSRIQTLGIIDVVEHTINCVHNNCRNWCWRWMTWSGNEQCNISHVQLCKVQGGFYLFLPVFSTKSKKITCSV